ncbi:MAG: hypothetical protein Q4C54_09455 [Clostridia bacterium]|nr:hypothetical protein [Clostridia bacterium]
MMHNHQNPGEYRPAHGHRPTAPVQPVVPPQPCYPPQNTMPMQPPKPEKKRRRFRLAPVRTILALIGTVAVLVVVARYAVVPLLVMLNPVFGG